MVVVVVGGGGGGGIVSATVGKLENIASLRKRKKSGGNVQVCPRSYKSNVFTVHPTLH